MKFTLPILLLVVAGTNCLQPCSCQEPLATSDIQIPDSAVAGFVAYPKTALTADEMDLFPHEIVTAWGEKEFGIDPMNIEFAIALVEEPTDNSEPLWGCMLRFADPIVLGGNFLRRIDRQGFKGMPSYPMGPSERVVVFNSRTLLLGQSDFLEKMISADEPAVSPLAELIRQQHDQSAFHVFIDVAALRPMVNEAIPEMEEIPEVLQPFTQIPNLIRTAHYQQNLNRNLTSQLTITAETGKAAELEGILNRGIQTGREWFLSELSSQMDMSDPVQQATIKYAHRLGDYIEQKLQPDREGDDLVYRADNSISSVPILTALLLPAVQQARSAARRTDSANRLKQMMLAIHNYHDVHRKFPTNVYDDNGQPLLSWRVQILPFVEQQALYEEFHLDEPWDSPHNERLIEQMPPLFQSPDAPLDPGKTLYLGVSGEEMIFGKATDASFRNIRDGTSLTIALVEADPEQAIIWTKPQDYQVDPANPKRGLGGLRPVGFNAAMFDGSVQVIAPDIDARTLLNLFKPNDGNAVRWPR